MKAFWYYDHGKARRNTPDKFLLDESGQYPFFYGKSLKILFFCAYWQRNSFWFRIFGYGLRGNRINEYPIMFSERNGYTKTIKLGNWSFKYLVR
jgi:hypothetical protein